MGGIYSTGKNGLNENGDRSEIVADERPALVDPMKPKRPFDKNQNTVIEKINSTLDMSTQTELDSICQLLESCTQTECEDPVLILIDSI